MKDLRRAIQITESCFRLAQKIIKLDITEIEIAKRMKKHALRLGAKRLCFPTIVSSGKSAKRIHSKLTKKQIKETIHSKPTKKKIKQNEFIIIDFGVVYKGKRTDMTRTFCIKPDKKKKKLYKLVKKAQKLAEKNIKPGISCFKVDMIVRNYLKTKTKYKFPYALGHGIGKKIHQKPIIKPRSKNIFKVGDIFTLEPGLHGKNVGIRIEDMYIVTKKGIKKLTKFPYKLTL